jgi:hypothetical protein
MPEAFTSAKLLNVKPEATHQGLVKKAAWQSVDGTQSPEFGRFQHMTDMTEALAFNLIFSR